MALNKTVFVDKCEVVSIGSTYTTNNWKVLQVRTATVIDEDGTELSRSFHRHLINPGTLTGVGDGTDAIRTVSSYQQISPKGFGGVVLTVSSDNTCSYHYTAEAEI